MLETVKTKYGLLKGVKSNDGFALFRGVPYAKAPIGELRWKAPQEPDSWQGVRMADTYGPACVQFDRWESANDDINDDSDHPYIHIPNYPYPPKMSEDCLYLNIYTPAERADEKLPVMIYIHGGGLQQWYGSDYEYCGDGFCRQGVILVSITYRLNVFGYLAHPLLRKESGVNSSGNYGLQDQLFALKWVKENIAAFGGDPKNITLFGQSAGGRSALCAVCSPLSEKMVRHVSIQSAGGVGSIMKETSYEEMEEKGIRFMEELGCTTLEQMRSLSWRVLRDANDRLGFFDGFGICVDGYVLKESVEDTILQGRLPDVDIIIGCTADEGANDKPPMFGSNLLAQICAFSRALLLNKHKPAYVYVFDRQQPGDDEGVPHSCDNRYQFATLDGSWRPYTDEDWELSAKMQKYWASFAVNGKPEVDNLPKWLPYDEEGLILKLCIDGPYMHDYSSPELEKQISAILDKQ